MLLYDIRSNKPYTVKDHRYELPIKEIEWHQESDLVLSIDKRVCKIWDRNSGKPFTSIEPGTGLNGLCLVPNSGMIFMANEAQKMLVYYIPVSRRKVQIELNRIVFQGRLETNVNLFISKF